MNSNGQHTTKYGQGILKFTLPNGLRLLLMEDHALPIVTIRAAFKGGLRAETEQNNGICNLMSNLLLKGTKTKSSSEIAKAIESRGGKIYSFSGANSFGISIDLLSVDIEIGLKLLGDILNNSTFPLEEIEIQKGEILSQIKSQRDDIFHISLRLLKETLFKSHPYGFESLGTEKTIEGITREDLKGLYQDLVIPNNMILAVFGDINAKKIQSTIEKDFGSTPKKEPGRINPIPEQPLERIREVKTYLASKEEAVIMIGFPTLSIYDGDRYVLEVISSLLSGEKGRLFDRVREQGGLAYVVRSYSVPGIEPGYYNFYASTSPQKINEVRELITEVVDLLKTTYVAEDELLRAKRELIGQHYIRLQRSGELALRCALDELYGLGYNYYRNYPERINIITREDIRRVANKYFPSDRCALIMVMPEKE